MDHTLSQKSRHQESLIVTTQFLLQVALVPPPRPLSHRFYQRERERDNESSAPRAGLQCPASSMKIEGYVPHTLASIISDYVPHKHRTFS